MLFEETTGALLCGDLFTHVGNGEPLTPADVVEPALQAEDLFRSSSLHPTTADAMRRLGDLDPTTLAIMHGSSFTGDGGQALRDLAASYEAMYLQPAA